MENKIISVFFAYNGKNKENIVKSFNNLKKSDGIEYKAHILYKGEIESFDEINAPLLDVSEYIKADLSELYKFAIPMVCNYERAIYLNADVEISNDVISLWNEDMKGQYVAAYHNTAFDTETMSRYTENVLGISHYVYVNDDILLLNPRKMKEARVYERFLLYYDFCQFRVNPNEALFNLASKDHILVVGNMQKAANESDAELEIQDENSFLCKWKREKCAQDRVGIEKKIADFEKEGIFDQDVEDDVPGRMIMPGEVEYIKKSLRSKVKAKIALKMALKFFYKAKKERQIIISDIKGIENYKNLASGAIITCNHFNAMDSFAMHWTYMQSKQKKKLYRIIREGNYTSFPGFFGFLMRNFYTLPLSSNHKTMKEFMEATNTLLKTGNFVLIYPEQSMWWNYRKPKPLKAGAFTFASKNQVPVLPTFITMKDSDILGPDGYYVQEYTVHVCEPIYPKAELNARENAEYMLTENERLWKEIYEREYQIPLEYTSETFEF